MHFQKHHSLFFAFGICIKNMTKQRRKRGSKTSSFGSPERVNHDSTAFYSSRLYEGMPKEISIDYVENTLPPEVINKIFLHSSENMSEIPNESIHLVVTSPPYNVGKEYDKDWSLEEYLSFLKRVWAEVYRVLVPGGRACINIANLGTKTLYTITCFYYS